MQFQSKKPQYEYLRKKWLARQKSAEDSLWEKHGKHFKQLAIGSLGGLLLLSAPHQPIVPGENLLATADDVLKGFDNNVFLAQNLHDILPEDVRPLNDYEESEISQVLSKNFGFKVTPSLDGIRLNRSYGLIGGEQHLYRYPGDTIYAQMENTSDWAKYGDAGMAPGLGAWGYFAPSKEEFTENDKQREKYYIAVQTFLAPGFAENVAKYRDFFKFRKMLVVNPKTGQSVVAIIGDSGPGEYTGKHLGGSPEVMDVLGLADGPRKGAVLYFFIDDPNDQVPLGPVKIKTQG